MTPQHRTRFEHERLKVFWKAREALDAGRRISWRSFPRHGDLRAQLERALTSVVLNTAEASAEFAPAEKARIFRIARRSAGEAAAILTVLPLHRSDVAVAALADTLLGEVGAMLTAICKQLEARLVAGQRPDGASAGPAAAAGGED